MSQAELTPDELSRAAAPLRRRLRSLRVGVVAWLLVIGLSYMAIAAVIWAAFSLGLDWWFEFDLPARVFLLGVLAAAVVVIAVRRIAAPAFRGLDDISLCQRVEARYPQLGERVVSALELARPRADSRATNSPALVRQTLAGGARAAEQVSFTGALNGSRLLLHLAVLAVLTAAFVSLAVFLPQKHLLRTWFDRNMLLQDRAYPRDVYLEFVGVSKGPIRVAHGDELRLTVRATEKSTTIPREIKVDYRAGGARLVETIGVKRVREFEIRRPGVTAPLRVRARHGRTTTRWLAVEVVQRPALDRRQLWVTDPEYAGGSRRELHGAGPYFVLPGSRLEFQGASSKPLSRVEATATPALPELLFAPDGPLLLLARQLTPATARPILRAITTHYSAQFGPRSIDVELASDNEFSFGLEPERLIFGQYRIVLYDREQPAPLPSRPAVRLEIRPRLDQRPAARLWLAEIESMPLVTADAELPLRGSASDDFALTRLELAHGWRDPQTDASATHEPAPLKADQPLSGAEGKAVRTASAEPTYIVRDHDPPPEGSVLWLKLAATDNNDVAGRRTGHSRELAMRVVSSAELRQALLRREMEQRQAVEQLLRRQQDLLNESQGLLVATRDLAAVDLATQRKLAEAARRQRQLAPAIAAVAKRLDQILIEARYNRLNNAELADSAAAASPQSSLDRRLSNQVIRPLRSLIGRANESLGATENAAPPDAGAALPQAVLKLEAARRLAGSQQNRNAALAAAIARQNEIVATLSEVLGHLQQVESYQAIVNAYYELLRLQTMLRELTEQERRRQEEKVLDRIGS